MPLKQAFFPFSSRCLWHPDSCALLSLPRLIVCSRFMCAEPVFVAPCLRLSLRQASLALCCLLSMTHGSHTNDDPEEFLKKAESMNETKRKKQKQNHRQGRDCKSLRRSPPMTKTKHPMQTLPWRNSLRSLSMPRHSRSST